VRVAVLMICMSRARPRRSSGEGGLRNFLHPETKLNKGEKNIEYQAVEANGPPIRWDGGLVTTTPTVIPRSARPFARDIEWTAAARPPPQAVVVVWA
jgi:hypothetical protein